MKTKTVKAVARSTDLDRLHGVVGGLLNQKCWKVGFGYGEELRLHLGARIPYGSPRMAGKYMGEWRLATCGTTWVLFTPKNGLVHSNRGSERTLAAKAKVLEGARIESLDVSVPSNALVIRFSNKCLFMVIPQPQDDRYDLPYWELFTPNHMVLAFGPGKRWSFTRSDVPSSPARGSIGRPPRKAISEKLRQPRLAGSKRPSHAE